MPNKIQLEVCYIDLIAGVHKRAICDEVMKGASGDYVLDTQNSPPLSVHHDCIFWIRPFVRPGRVRKARVNVN